MNSTGNDQNVAGADAGPGNAGVGDAEAGASRPADNKRRLSLPSSLRIRTSGEFQKIYAIRASAASEAVIIYAMRNGRSFTRFGLSVGRKHGNAVERNRIKRLLRETFRLTRHDLPMGYDLILIPRRMGRDVSLACLREELPQIVRQAAARADRKAEQVGRTVAGQGDNVPTDRRDHDKGQPGCTPAEPQ